MAERAIARPRRAAMLPNPIAALAAYGFFQLMQRARTPMLPSPAQWIRLDEAAAFSGLSVTLLKRLIAAHKLAAIRDGAVKVRRADLASLDNLVGMAECTQTLKAAAAELRRRRKA